MIKHPMDTDLKLHMAPPLGLLTIVNLLREEHTVSLENENIQSINGIIVVAGGIHITTAYDTIPNGVFDVSCVGAAEGTWPDIMLDGNCF